MTTPQPRRLRRNRSLLALARFAVDRLKRAMTLYWRFSDPRDAELADESRRAQATASLVVDRDKNESLLELIVGEQDASGIPLDIVRHRNGITQVRQFRNDFLHGGRLPSLRPEALASVRDAIVIGLHLFRQFPELHSQWDDVGDTIWQFVRQTDFVATQIRETFSSSRFTGLSATLRLDRELGGEDFTLRGDISAAGRVYSYFWRQNGSVPREPDIFAKNSIDVGAIEMPRAAFDAEHREQEHSGVLECIIRGVESRAEGFNEDSNPLLTRIRLEDCADSAWTYGPGHMAIEQLVISIPYRVRSAWYRTTERRLHILSRLVTDHTVGTVSGRLTFFLSSRPLRQARTARARKVDGNIRAA